MAGLEKLVRFICKVADFSPRYNLAPRQQAPVLVWENGTAVLKPMRWGLIPSWAKDETIGDKLTNARAETVTKKSSYRRPFQKQRCLIPADGFYEWQASPTGKTPFRFTHKDGAFFCMVGLWDKWIRPPHAGELNLNDTEPSASQTLLPNGQVLVAGGIYGDNNNILSSSELYDPASGNPSRKGHLGAAVQLAVQTEFRR